MGQYYLCRCQRNAVVRITLIASETEGMITHLQKPHASDTAECFEVMATTETGLSENEAARRLVEYGPNKLLVRRPRSRVLRFWRISTMLRFMC